MVPDTTCPLLRLEMLHTIQMDIPSFVCFLSSAGFVLFYDFVSGIDMRVQVLRLVAVLYKVGSEVRDPVILPKISCDSFASTVYGDRGKAVVIGAVQSHSEYV